MRQYACSIMIVSITALTWRTPFARADVNVCGTATWTNNTGVDANDFHFNMYQNDRPEVTVTGASASSTNCSSTTATQDSAHSANVDGTGCNIPAGGTIAIKVCLTMTERNCLKLRDAYFTFDGTPIPPGGGGGGGGGPPPPKGGWRVKRPFPGGTGGNTAPGGGGQGNQQGGGGGGKHVHRVCYENDGTVPIEILELRLTSAMPLYDTSTLDMSDSVPINDPANPYPICVPAGGKYCYDFNTTGSYLGGHVYQKWIVKQAPPGDCGVPPLGGSALPAAAPPPPDSDPDALKTIGDHPVEALCTEVLDGNNYFVTTNPTSFNFSDTPIPAGFFDPGSEPFTGTIQLGGLPIDIPNFGPTDTIVQRLGEAYLPNNGSTDTVPIIIEGLSLVSVNPISIIVDDPNQPTFFDALTLTTQTGQPPAQIKLSITNDNISDGIEDLSLQSVNPPAMVIRGTASDTSGGVGLWGNIANFDVFFQPSGPIPSFPGNSSIKVACIIHSPGGSGFFPMPQSPQLQWTPFNSFFDVFYSVPITGVTDHFHIHYQIGPGQPLQIQSVNFGPSYNGNSLFDVNIVLQATGAINNAQPLIQTVTSGYSSPTSTKFFDVFMTLDENVGQPQGSMSITRTTNDGGTFTSSLPVKPKFIFTNVNPPGDTHVLDTLPSVTTLQLDPHPWTYAPLPGELQVPYLSTDFHPGVEDPNVPTTALQWQEPDGSPHTVNPTMAQQSITQWRSVRTHGFGAGELAIVLDPAATGATSTKPTVETRGVNATAGVFKVQVDFDGPVTLVNAANITVTYRPTIQGGSPSIGSPVSVIPSSVVMSDADTLDIIFTSGQLPNLGCANITIGAGTFAESITGDTDCNIRVLAGDVNSSGTVNTTDQAAIKAEVAAFTPATAKPKFDLNLTGTPINTTDQAVMKSFVVSPAKTALCP